MSVNVDRNEIEFESKFTFVMLLCNVQQLFRALAIDSNDFSQFTIDICWTQYQVNNLGIGYF